MISLTTVRAGDAFNVLPNSVMVGGTFRFFTSAMRDLIMHTIRVRAESIAESYGCTAIVDFGEDDVKTNSVAKSGSL